MPAEDPKPGEILTADHLAHAMGLGERTPPRESGQGYGVSGSFGQSGVAVPRQEFWILLTGGGTGGAYSWSEQVPDSGGSWVAGGRSGTSSDDPAREVNGNDALATGSTLRAWARRDHDGVLRFELGTCS
jgi:hypothetical protein